MATPVQYRVLVKPGDSIAIKDSSQTKKIFENVRTILKKFEPPSWLELDKEKLVSAMVRLPDQNFLKELPVELSKVLEYYSR